MHSKYTAIVFANNFAIQQENSNHLPTLVAKLLAELDSALVGSYGIIHDNTLNMIIQRYNKASIED